jgi:hypothetical protein
MKESLVIAWVFILALIAILIGAGFAVFDWSPMLTRLAIVEAAVFGIGLVIAVISSVIQ